MTEHSPLSTALAKRKVSAAVKDLDHHRIGAGFAVETDFIIKVEPKSNVTPEESFAPFKLSKTYSAFRTLTSQLQKIAEKATKKEKDWENLPAEVKQSIKFTESLSHLVQTQRTQYLGKVNFNYVKSLAQQRSQTINDVLDSLLQNYPATANGATVLKELAEAIELFFLTDHVDEDDASTIVGHDERSGSHKKMFTPSRGAPIGELGKLFRGNSKKEGEVPKGVVSPVVPVTRKHRKSVVFRAQDEAELLQDEDQAKLFLDDDRDQKTMLPSYSAPVSVVQSGGNKLAQVLETNPYVFLLITLVCLAVLRSASFTQVTIDTDVFLLVVFAFFCLGFHLPRQTRVGLDAATPVSSPVVTFQKPKSDRRRSSDALLRRSMMASPKAEEEINKAWEEIMEEEEAPLIQSPLEVFPEGAKLGSKFNCWSQPKCTDFHVRGPKYLKDKKKIPSGDFVFPCRGVDLFLTDLSPENVGSITGVMGGVLREVPTFIVNYRLPWGVLLYYFEIPEKFLPFIHKRYEPDFDESTLPSLDTWTPAERTVARFLMGSDKYKDQRLKIVPVVVEGPWVVKSVVGGKPAILGTKLPVTYVYQKQEGEKAMYLEADLDIVASSAARGILSVVRNYTSGLTMDMGYVVQGNEEDELPECMLTGTRMHGIDPMSAPALPPMKDRYMGEAGLVDESE